MSSSLSYHIPGEEEAKMYYKGVSHTPPRPWSTGQMGSSGLSSCPRGLRRTRCAESFAAFSARS